MKHCSILACNKTYYAKGLCEMHYARVRKGKSALAPTPYTYRPAVIEGDIAKLTLGGNKGYAIVDKADAGLDKYHWSLDGSGYPAGKVGNSVKKLHHVVIGKPPKGLVTDHINRNKLDSRRSNLRHVTQRVNTHNVNILKTNTSGHTGVTWSKNSRRWVAQGHFNGKKQSGGYHATIEEAVKARKELEQIYKN